MRIPDLYHAIWRHRIFVLVMTALTVAAVWVVTARQQKMYTASTLIRVAQKADTNPADVINGLDAGQRLAQTYARIAETRTIQNLVYNELNGAVGLKHIDITASPVQDLELLTLSATHPSPRLAELVANAAPNALKSFVSQSGSPPEQVIVVERAKLPTSPSSPRLKLNIALGLVLGLVLNGFLALLAEIMRDPLPEGAQLEELLRSPVLATVPTLEFIEPRRRRSRSFWRKQPEIRTVDRELTRARSLTRRPRSYEQPRLQTPAAKSERARR